MICEKFKDNLSAYIDKNLNEIEMKKMELHLIECESCRIEYELMIEIIELSVDEVELPDGYHEELCDKLNKEFKNVKEVKSLESIRKEKAIKISVKKVIPYLSIAAAVVLMITTYPGQKENMEYYFNDVEEVSVEKSLSEESFEIKAPMLNSNMKASVKSVKSMDAMPNIMTQSLGEEFGKREPKIIKNASVELVVEKYDQKIDQIKLYLENQLGYMENQETYKNDDLKFGNIQLKIPKNSFDECIEFIKTLGEIKNERVFSNDITDEYYDIELRLNNMKSQNDRYKNLLQKAETVEDLLAIENEMSRLAVEIESLEGRLKAWDNSVEYSRINVAITEVKSIKPIIETSNESLMQRIHKNFILKTNEFIRELELLLIGITGNIIYILLVIGIITGGYRFFKNKILKKRERGN